MKKKGLIKKMHTTIYALLDTKEIPMTWKPQAYISDELMSKYNKANRLFTEVQTELSQIYKDNL